MSSNLLSVSVDLNGKFLKSIFENSRVYVLCDTLLITREFAVSSCKIYNEKGQICYFATHTKSITNLRPKL